MVNSRLILSLVLLTYGQSVLFAQKIDTIYFQSGDRVTGEVKLLENNYLKLSTNDAGTMMLEWNKIDSVKILNPMRIVFENGVIYYGKLLPSGKKESCYIWSTVGDPRLTALTEIVYLSPFVDRFVDRLSGSLSSGFSYTKASEVMTVNFNGSVNYIAKKNQLGLSYDGNVTRQDTTDTSQRQNGGVTFQRILPRKWFLISKLNFESNSALDLDLRTSFAAGGGNSLISTNRTNFYIAGGIQGTREVSLGEGHFNIEGLIGSSYSVFIYDSPEVSFNLFGDVIPSLNDWGRVRVDVDSNLSWEIFDDFYLKWTFFYSFDSRPPSGTAERNDWAVTLLGIEYKL
jgi:hypothetical protein